MQSQRQELVTRSPCESGSAMPDPMFGCCGNKCFNYRVGRVGKRKANARRCLDSRATECMQCSNKDMSSACLTKHTRRKNVRRSVNTHSALNRQVQSRASAALLSSSGMLRSNDVCRMLCDAKLKTVVSYKKPPLFSFKTPYIPITKFMYSIRSNMKN